MPVFLLLLAAITLLPPCLLAQQTTPDSAGSPSRLAGPGAPSASGNHRHGHAGAARRAEDGDTGDGRGIPTCSSRRSV